MAPIIKKRSIATVAQDSMDGFESSESEHDSIDTSASEQTTGTGKYAKVNRIVLEKNSDEYKKRRERNNMAVKKSRNKSKVKTIQTLERVNQLKSENDELQQKIDILTKELRLLKDLFMAHANNAHGTELADMDLKIFANVSSSLPQQQQQPAPAGFALLPETMGQETGPTANPIKMESSDANNFTFH